MIKELVHVEIVGKEESIVELIGDPEHGSFDMEFSPTEKITVNDVDLTEEDLDAFIEGFKLFKKLMFKKPEASV